MDRDSYDARSQDDRTARHAIAYAPVQPRAALRGPRCVRESEPRRGHATGPSRGHATGPSRGHADRRSIGFVLLALGIALVLKRMRHSESGRRPWPAQTEADGQTSVERLIDWLNDAYAHEHVQIRTLSEQADAAREHPHIRRKIRAHLKQTRRHAEMVGECVRLLGGEPERGRRRTRRVMRILARRERGDSNDGLVRDLVADYGSENLEVASYRAIILAAQDAGHTWVADVCERILAEEEAMVDWLRSELPGVVRENV